MSTTILHALPPVARRGWSALAIVAVLGACADSPTTGPDVNPAVRGGDRDAPARAEAYINPDVGLASFNPTVNLASSCDKPDRRDMQQLSTDGTADRNVHIDACFFGSRGGDAPDGPDRNIVKADGPASFEVSGVGFISACPDPDGAGPKVAVLSADRTTCFQSGYQEKGAAGDFEFHARFNSTAATDGAGGQAVVWCYDPEQNGCADARVKSIVRIDWTD